MAHRTPLYHTLKPLAASILISGYLFGAPVYGQTVPAQTLAPTPQEEQALTQVTIPPATSEGASENGIYQYFDEPYPATAKARQLPPDTKQTLDAINKHWTEEKQASTSKPIVLERGNFPDATIDGTVKEGTGETQPKNLGITLSTPAPKAPTVGNLQEQAYNALMAGQVEVAISLYKKALLIDPKNRLSMFGLATTYHRNGQATQARKLYSEILRKFPNDRDTLNNFLVLISETAPQDAFFELQHLQDANPNFSPIPAQIGMLYQRMGNNDKAIEYLKKAISISPENLSYRYNLAILFDRMGKWQEATMLYQQLIAAARVGETIPGDSKAIEDRLMFITKRGIEG